MARTSAVGRGGCDSSRPTSSSCWTIRVRRSAWSEMTVSRGSLLRSVAASASAFDRIEVKRRLEVVADAAQEVVLDLAQLAQLAVLVLDLGEQLGVADRDADLAGVQVEQGLVGPLPGPCRGQARQEETQPLVAGAKLGADRDARRRGCAPRARRCRGRRTAASAAMKPNAARASRAASLGHRVDAVARLGRLDRGQDQPELAVAPLGVAGQAVVALGQLGQDVAARRPGSAGSGRRRRRADTAAEISRSGATRSSPTADPPRMPTATAIANMNSSSRAPTSGSTAPLAMSSTPKIAERDDRRGQEGQGQPRLERQGDASPAPVRRLGHASSSSASGAARAVPASVALGRRVATSR